MTTPADEPTPLEPLDEDDEATAPDHDDPIDERDQTDAKLGDEHPGDGDPGELPPPVPGP